MRVVEREKLTVVQLSNQARVILSSSKNCVPSAVDQSAMPPSRVLRSIVALDRDLEAGVRFKYCGRGPDFDFNGNNMARGHFLNSFMCVPRAERRAA